MEKRMYQLKVLTRCVSIHDEKFVLVKLTHTDVKYGTISYDELDDKGCMKRELNGFDMCIADSIDEALESRKFMIETRNMSMEQLVQYVKNTIRA